MNSSIHLIKVLPGNMAVPLREEGEIQPDNADDAHVDFMQFPV